MVDLNISIPPDFLEDETRCKYTITCKKKEIWAIEMDLLCELDRICRKYSIKYFAFYGTLLGAVRHHGFIPWDDDIDLFMTRENYDNFCMHAKEFKYPYFFQTEYTDPGSVRGHIQIRNCETTGALVREKSALGINQGIFIDVFPLDKIPDSEIDFIKQVKRIKYYKYLALFLKKSAFMPDKKSGFISIIKKIYRGVYKVFKPIEKIGDYFYKKFELECRRYNDTDSKVYSMICFPQFGKIKISFDQISDCIMMQFEFIKIPIPIGYDYILRQLYGDYHMIVHSESGHGSVIFDTDTSYITVLAEHYNNQKYS